jgi:hypothetical protein
MDARVEPQQETRFLPAVAEAVAAWFPDLGGRAIAVSEVSITKDNVPTLPLALVAFVRSVSEQPANSRVEMFDITDTFIVDFWLPPARYKTASGAETPYWSYYDYEGIRDKLLTNLSRWQTPGGERIAYRGMVIEAEPLAVTLTFTFIANFRWCPTGPKEKGDKFTVEFNLCAPESCIPDHCPEPVDPCDNIPTGGIRPPEEDLEEAPNDGKMYVRQNGEWVELPVSQASMSFNYKFDGQTVNPSDPGSGKLRYSSVVLADITELYVDRLTSDGLDTTTMFTTMKFSDEIVIQEKDFALRNQVFRLTGAGEVMPDWFKIPVEFVSSNGSPFNNNLNISVLTRSS